MKLVTSGRQKIKIPLQLFPQRYFKYKSRKFHICFLCGGWMEIRKGKKSHDIAHENCVSIFYKMKKRGIVDFDS